LPPLDPALTSDLSHDLGELREVQAKAARAGEGQRGGGPAATTTLAPRRTVDAASLLRPSATRPVILLAPPSSPANGNPSGG
jgi:hypothetical protein